MLLSVNVSFFCHKAYSCHTCLHSLYELYVAKNLAVNKICKICILTMYLNQRIQHFWNFNHTFKIEEIK